MKAMQWFVFGPVVLGIFWLSGCNLIKPVTLRDKMPQKSEMQYFSHQIRWPGENLIRISRWYTGSGENWTRIAKANPSIDARRLIIGDMVAIPDDLLITRQPMPSNYRTPGEKNKETQRTSIEKQQEIKKPTIESPPKPIEIELYGPIDTGLPSDQQEGVGPIPPLETIE